MSNPAHGMGEAQPDDQAGLAHLDEPLGVPCGDRCQAGGEGAGQGVDPGGGLRPGRDGHDRAGHPAAELGPAEGGDVRPAVVLQPGTGACGEQGRGDRVEAAGQALAGHEDVGGDVGALPRPRGTRAAQPGLHLVGDVQRAVAVAELADAREVVGGGGGEAHGGGDRLEDDRGRGGGGQRLLECGQVIERDLGELLVAAGGQEGLGLPRGHRPPAPARCARDRNRPRRRPGGVRWRGGRT